jgi:hypothetical protein
MAVTINGTTGVTTNNSVYTDAFGNTGIGTTSPGNKLVTASNVTNSKIEIQNTSTAASTSKTSALQFTGTDTVGTLKESGDIFVTPADNNYVGSNMLFYTRGSDTVSLRIIIDSSGNVGIGTTTPSASAILDAQSTTKGVRMPNMTTTQKNAISSPAAGLMVFDTTLSKLCVYTGAAWQTITSA